MTSRRTFRAALSALAIGLALGVVARPQRAVAADASAPGVEQQLRGLAPAGADDCTSQTLSAPGADIDDLERQLFRTVMTQVAERMNAGAPAPGGEALARATSTLREIEAASAEINKDWPDESRFHFQVMAAPPAILVQASYRYHEVFALFGSYDLGKAETDHPGTRWREVDFADPDGLATSVRLVPLHRGPSHRLRFLAEVFSAGCGGSIGHDYYGYEWAPQDGMISTEIIKLEGAKGLDDTASVQVGTLVTAGAIIQLPYCFFSAVDTWDNPTLCAADTFDLSGDDIRFKERRYNAPDLVTVVRAIQYAQARDVAALRAYCASDGVARRLVRDVPRGMGVLAETLETRKAGPARETVSLSETTRFHLVRRKGRWLVEGFEL